MKLVSFKADGAVRIGAVVGDSVIAINDFMPPNEQVSDDMVAFLAAGDPAMQVARKAVAAPQRSRPRPLLALLN